MASQNSPNYVNDKIAKLVKDAAGIDGVTQKQVKAICNSLFDVVISQLEENGNVKFTNFIKFNKVLRKERTYKNPKTGETTVKPEHYTVTVTPMTHLKKVISEGGSLSDDAMDVAEEHEKHETSDNEEDEEVVEVKPKKEVKKKVPAKKKAVIAKKKGGKSGDDFESGSGSDSSDSESD